MNPRPYYALIVLAIVLTAALHLAGSSQLPVSPPRTVALAPRPMPVVVAEVKKPLPLDYLLEEIAAKPTAVVKKTPPFIDHHELMKAVFSMSSAGVGNPTMFAKTAGPASENFGLVVQKELEPGSESLVAAERPMIGFEEFTAIVQQDELRSESVETSLAWQNGCGIDHATGDVYPQPGTVDYSQLANRSADRSAGAVIWQGILRFYTEEVQNLLHGSRWSFLPHVADLLEFTMRRVALD